MTLCCTVFDEFELKKKKKEEKKMNKTPYHSPYIYNARYHVNPYILSITVLSDIGLSTGFGHTTLSTAQTIIPWLHMCTTYVRIIVR